MLEIMLLRPYLSELSQSYYIARRLNEQSTLEDTRELLKNCGSSKATFSLSIIDAFLNRL